MTTSDLPQATNQPKSKQTYPIKYNLQRIPTHPFKKMTTVEQVTHQHPKQ